MPRHIKALLGAANPSKLRGIFLAEFSVLVLRSGEKVEHTLPKSPGQWKHVISMVLDYRNRDIGPHEARFELNLPRVEAHAKILHQHCHITPRP